MDETIKALEAAIYWIRTRWIASGESWTGDVSELVGACEPDLPLTGSEIRNVWQAVESGEPIEVDGWTLADNKVTVWSQPKTCGD